MWNIACKIFQYFTHEVLLYIKLASPRAPDDKNSDATIASESFETFSSLNIQNIHAIVFQDVFILVSRRARFKDGGHPCKIEVFFVKIVFVIT